jgi:hypothetical protein
MSKGPSVSLTRESRTDELKGGWGTRPDQQNRRPGRLMPGSSFAIFDGVHIRWRLTLAAFFAGCWMLFFAATPWWIGKTIDAITTSGTTVTDIVHRCAVLLACAAGGAVAVLAEERTSVLLRVDCELSLMLVLSRQTSNLSLVDARLGFVCGRAGLLSVRRPAWGRSVGAASQSYLEPAADVDPTGRGCCAEGAVVLGLGPDGVPRNRSVGC